MYEHMPLTATKNEQRSKGHYIPESTVSGDLGSNTSHSILAERTWSRAALPGLSFLSCQRGAGTPFNSMLSAVPPDLGSGASGGECQAK